MTWDWALITIVAILFGGIAIFNFYRFYKNASDEDRPKLLKLYGALFIVSVVIVIVIRTFWGIDYRKVSIEDLQKQNIQEYYDLQSQLEN